MVFADVLEAADDLSLDEQETLLEILHRRIVERRREGLAREIREARAEFEAGDCRPMTAAELIAEARS